MRLSHIFIFALASWTVSAQMGDMLPAIEAVSFGYGSPANRDFLKVLTEPQDFVQEGSNSDSYNIQHVLKCEASNADTIYWEYKKLKTDDWGRALPEQMRSGTPVPPNGGEKISLTIDDGDTAKIKELSELNGFYRCTAEQAAKGYKVQAPPVRIVIPYVANKEPTLQPITGQPEVNKAFSMKCFSDVDNQLIPTDTAEFATILFRWEVRIGTAAFNYPNGWSNVKEPSRIKIDPLTGTLHFAYMKPEDKLETVGPGSIDQRFNCYATVGSQQSILVGAFGGLIPAANNDPIKKVDLLSPPYKVISGEKVAQKEEPCTAGKKCTVVAIFSGLDVTNGTVRGIRPDTDNIPFELQDYPGFEFITPKGKSSQVYTVQLFNKHSGDVYDSFKLNVTINNYPRLADKTQFPAVRYVESQKKVDFICDAEHTISSGGTKFFINGRQVDTSYPSYVTEVGKNSFTVGSTKRDDSFSVQCESIGAAGTLYTTSVLNVYDPANLTQHPKVDYVVQTKNNTDTIFMFNCSVILDTKAAVKDGRPEMYWMSDRKNTAELKIKDKDDEGVKNVFTKPYDPKTGIIESTLTLELDTETDTFLQNTKWWCQVEYSILDDTEVHTETGEKRALLFEAPVTQPVVDPPWPYYPVVFGAIGGLIFLILLIVLINCYVQKNKGEQYYVDAKERGAGHNPEEELEAYGFSDYTRPDQNPIKGSRASMNYSDKPMESDNGSLDAYGTDMDPSRYNEDGSFIGQYGQNGSHPRHQADV